MPVVEMQDNSMHLDELEHILRCPSCAAALAVEAGGLRCGACGLTAVMEDGVVDFEPRIPSLPYYDREYREAAAKMAALHEAYYNKKSASGVLEGWFKRWFVEFVGEFGPMVYDIGCGTARLFEYLPDTTVKVGIDINRELLKTAAGNHPDALFLCCDLINAPLAPGKIDEAISLFTLEHIFSLEAVLGSVAGLLSPKGRFYVAIPTEGGALWTLLREVAHWKYSRELDMDYRRLARKEHINSATYIDAAIRKHFHVARRRYAPLRVPTTHVNCAVFYELHKL